MAWNPLGRKETENGRGSRVAGRGGQRGEQEMCAVGAGGCRRTARVECERERVGIAGGRGGGGFGATTMSVCTRTPSRPRRWRNVATQPQRKREPHRAAPTLSGRRINALHGRVRGPEVTTRRCVGRRESRLYDQRRDVDGDDDVRCVRDDFVTHVAAVNCVYATAQRYVTDVWLTRAKCERALVIFYEGCSIVEEFRARDLIAVKE